MAADLCFAYGSITDNEGWRAWCARNSVAPGCVWPVGTVLLPDRRLAFAPHATSEGAGALTVREHIGSYVEGVLLCVTPEGWDALDRKEDMPDAYQRISRTVILPGGTAARAIVHELARSRWGAFAPPADMYLASLRRGFAAHGMDPAPLEAAARGKDGFSVLADVFAYGTLMRGEVRHAPAVRAGLVSARSARARGRLHDLGAYPGMVLEGSRDVQGELLSFADPAVALRVLDRIEEARPHCAPGGPYRRTILTVRDAEGQERRAWAYVMERARVASAPVIASGSWRRRQGALPLPKAHSL